MLFNSQIFLLVFLPLTLLLYYELSANKSVRLWLLIIASLVFYGYWDINFLPFLLVSVLFNWLLAKAHTRFNITFIVILSVALNLAAIGYFKYLNFFSELLGMMFDLETQRFSIVLPLGISFFTFQQIAYLVDLKRGKAHAYSLTEYAAFVTFFPQLIAGPIVRHYELVPQFNHSPVNSQLHENMAKGGILLAIGLLKKVIIADEMASIATPLFDTAYSGEALSMGSAWLSTLAYSCQLYFDFSAYSDMAIGLGLLFGFTLPVNFNSPYRSTNLRDFWRRWHITLSRFLRDYLYIPLGGNRAGHLKQLVAFNTTMLLGGLWHGAALNFIAWGGLHGIGLVANTFWQKSGIRMPSLLGWLITIWFVMCCWIIFRAQDLTTAFNILSSMHGLNGYTLEVSDSPNRWNTLIAVLIALFAPNSQKIALHLVKPRTLYALGITSILLFITLKLGDENYSEFIYFQF